MKQRFYFLKSTCNIIVSNDNMMRSFHINKMVKYRKTKGKKKRVYTRGHWGHGCMFSLCLIGFSPTCPKNTHVSFIGNEIVLRCECDCQRLFVCSTRVLPLAGNQSRVIRFIYLFTIYKNKYIKMLTVGHSLLCFGKLFENLPRMTEDHLTKNRCA